MERIPRQSDAWRKVMLLCLVHVLAKWRSRGVAIESGWTSLEILRVNNHAIAIVSRSRAPVSSAGNNRRLRRIPKAREEIRQHSVAIVRRSEVGVADTKTQREVVAHTVLILRKPLDRLDRKSVV